MDENDIKNLSGAGIDVMWNITVFDVEKTLRNAIDKLFRDKSVEQQVRRIRAQGLLKLGRLFEKYGDSTGKGLAEMKQQISGQISEAQKAEQNK